MSQLRIRIGLSQRAKFPLGFVQQPGSRIQQPQHQAPPSIDAARLRQVRAACPQARLIADANEAWTPELLPSLMAIAAETGVELIEQPLPAGADAALAGSRAVPVCADESLHDRAGLDALVGRYDFGLFVFLVTRNLCSTPSESRT